MKKNFLFLFIVIILVGLQIWSATLFLRFPYMGIFLQPNQQQEWVIKELDHRGVGSQQDLKVGDIVKQVDGKNPDEFETINKWRSIEKARQLVISRNGIESEITIIKGDTGIKYGFISLFSGLFSLSVALLLFIKMPSSQSARMLSFVFLTGDIIWTSLSAASRGDILGKILISSLMMALPIIFYHFLVNFFKEKGDIALPLKIIKPLYVVLILAFGIRLFYFMPSLAYYIYQFDGSVTLSFFVVGFLFNIITLTVLFFKYRKEKSYISTIIKSVWFSLFISFMPAIVLSFVPRLIFGNYIMDDQYTSLLILFFPISFAYLLASNQLYDIGMVVRRVISTAVLTIVPCALFMAAYAAIFPEEADAKHILFIFFFLVIIISLVLYSMEYFTTKFERFLFPRKHVLHSALKKISRNLGSISSFRELRDIILVDIVNTLEVKGGAVVIHYGGDMDFINQGEINESEIKSLLNSSSLFHHPLYTCIEINSHEDYTSYLIMTRKKTNTLLGKEELQWLNIMISYLAVSLENVHLIRKLTSRLQHLASHLPDEQAAQDIQWFRKLMFELQEEERRRIAADLHDTTMQDLFFLKRRFVSLLEKYVMSPEDKETLHNIINFVELINTSLRQSCFELNPYLLQEIGLIQTVQKLLEKERFDSAFTIEFTADRVTAIEHKDLITKRHIFRMVQELLNNAKKHSEASKVIFKMFMEDGFFLISYEDDGIGFAQKEDSLREIGASRIGLEQMRSRVLHLNGNMELNSQVNKGVRILISIPLKEVKAI
ncbi:two-component system, NarL family, sensor histidine kinase ComP [Paenibacillus sp. GP183]|nr:two-component system, NarL family, sensor histidine kinase ComP [Paenibacillus sp. GP183]